MESEGEAGRYDRFESERFPVKRRASEQRRSRHDGKRRRCVESSPVSRRVSVPAEGIQHEVLEHRTVVIGPSVQVQHSLREKMEPPAAAEVPERIAVVVGNRPMDGRTCKICNLTVWTSLKRHVWRVHLPWFWRPELACWKCEKACAGAAELEERHLKRHPEGAFRTEDQLARWMDTMKAILELEASWFALSPELLLWKAREEVVRRDSFGESLLRVVFLEWLYNWIKGMAVQTPVLLEVCPSWVMMWDTQMCLLSQLDGLARQQIRDFRLSGDSHGHTFPVRVADGHCHLIDMARRFRQKQPAVALQLAKEEANSSIISKVDVIIDNHVFPNSWSRDYVVPSVDVRYCVGVHPRMVNGFILWRKLEARFQDSRCVGIGESGLDTTAPDMESQKVLLKEVATFAAQHGKPLVLHVRDDQQGIDGLFQTVLHILDTALTPGHTLYLHSYTGGWETALAFRKWSSRTYFGISCATMRSAEFAKLAGHLPIECLVLESDAPHLAPPGYSRNSPYLLGYIAEQVAIHRNLPPALILDVSRRNVLRVFRI